LRPEGCGLLVTCEHGGNQVPPALAHRFAAAGSDLCSHRGWDPGALDLAKSLARSLGAPLLQTETSRLVVDLNRAARSRTLFSEYTRTLGRDEREALLREYYDPYREAVTEAVVRLLANGRTVVHLSVHTFTPSLQGRERKVDVGLLYDPSRAPERALCFRWQGALVRADAARRVRRNYPYRGTADGLATTLRKQFGPEAYLGLELEMNQRHALGGGASWLRLQQWVCEGLAEALDACPGGPPIEVTGPSRKEEA